MTEITPTAMTQAQLVEFLSRAGAQSVTEGSIAADISAGAPTNEDGTVNLLHYAAWLSKT